MSLPASTHPLEAVQGAPFNLFQANVFFDLSLTRGEKAHLLNDTYHALASALPPFDFCADKPITLDKSQKVLLREDFQCRQPLSDGSKYVKWMPMNYFYIWRHEPVAIIYTHRMIHTHIHLQAFLGRAFRLQSDRPHGTLVATRGPGAPAK